MAFQLLEVIFAVLYVITVYVSLMDLNGSWFYICSFSNEATSEIYKYFQLWNQTADMPEFYFRFRFWPHYRHRHVTLRRPTKFYLNLNGDGAITALSILQDGGHSVVNLLPACGMVTSKIYKVKRCSNTRFVKVSQFAAEILLRLSAN